jgi:FtsH-binding integral membrane protein
MDKKDGDKKDVEEKLIKWNDIFEELLIDSRTLVKDLSEGINYIAASALIVIVIGGAALFVGLDRGETKYVAAGFVIFCVCIFNGAMTLRKWHKLKKRYNCLQSLQKEMEHQ